MILLEIPLINSPDQTLDIELDNVPYTLRVLYNERFGYFSLTISEKDGDMLLSNIKMVNNYPLVKRYQRLNMKGDLYFIHKGGKTTRPTLDEIGIEYGLYYYDDEASITLPIPNAPIGATQSVWDGGNTIWDSGTSNWV